MKWYEVKQFSRIILDKVFRYYDISGNPVDLLPGIYYITGFWADVCGLAKTKEDAKKIRNDFVIPAKSLVFFNGIEK